MDNDVNLTAQQPADNNPAPLSGKSAELHFLRSARNNVTEADRIDDSIRKLSNEEKKAKKNLAAAKKEVENEIEQAVKAGREEAYGSLIAEAEGYKKALDAVKAERAQSKEKGVAERIASETADFYKENDEKQKEINEIYKEDKVPFFCKWRYYFALFAPKGALDLALLVITQLVAFGLIPMIAYFLIKERQTYHLAIIYIAAIVIFGGLYLLILEFTRIKHNKAIKTARDLSVDIRTNKKKIKAVEKNIVNDTDESLYDLSEVDARVDAAQKEYDAAAEKLADAKAEFENVTLGEIVECIEAENSDRIKELEDESAAKEKAVVDAKAELDRLDYEYETIYRERIPKDYLKENKLNRLIELIEDGDAVTVESAVLIMKSMGK